MHLVLLGVMKKMLIFWRDGTTTYHTKLATKDISNISTRLLQAGVNQSKEFTRVDVIAFWKATEFRTFLLHTGPIILKNILPPEPYSHFLLLQWAVTMPVSSEHLLYIDTAEKLFEIFVNDSSDKYEKYYSSFNFHNVKNLIKEVLLNFKMSYAMLNG